MKHLDEYSTITTVIEKLIEHENETIAIYENILRETGESVISPLLHRLIEEKKDHRASLEHELEDLNDHFELDEAIV